MNDDRGVRLALTEEEIVLMWEFVSRDTARFRRLFRFLADLAQAPIVRPGMEIHVVTEGAESIDSGDIKPPQEKRNDGEVKEDGQ